MHIYWRINDDFESIFDADQRPEVHLAGNDYNLALICKESTKTHTYKTDFSYCNTSKFYVLVQKFKQRC